MFDLRSLVRDSVGFILYFCSWYSLAFFPLLLIAGVLSESGVFGVSFLDGVSFVEVVVFGINLMQAMLVGLILRWLARGIVEGNRIKTIFVALCVIGAGTFFLFVGCLSDEKGWASQLPIIIIGTFMLVVGLVLCIVANPAARRNRT